MSDAIRTASVARTILLVIGIALVLMEVIALGYRMSSDWNMIAHRAERRAGAALDLLETLHQQAMLNSSSANSSDPAIRTLDGAIQQFSADNNDIRLWLSMGPKLIAQQMANVGKAGATGEIERPRNRVDRAAIETATTQTAIIGDWLHVARPAILGVGNAAAPRCASCHADLVKGDVIGTYSAAVNLAFPRAQWRQDTMFEIATALGIVLISIGTIAAVLSITTLTPLRRLTAATRDLSEGNLAVAIEGATRSDELGTLARSLVVFRNNLLDKHIAEDKIAHMAQHDALTGLPNRASLRRFLDKAVAECPSNMKIGLASLDLDDFKQINDTHGHNVGDRVIAEVAANLAETLDEGEFVARVGGDEFVAFRRYRDQSDLFKFVGRLKRALHIDHGQNVDELNPTAHIGVAVWPNDARTTDALLAKADNALERSKASTVPNGVCYYEALLDKEARRRRFLIAGLAIAAKNGELSLHYQVQKSLKTMAVTGYEALLRWTHPQLGPISPAEFIPLAETCGAIHEIGEWVLRTACRDAAAWPSTDKVAVNLSGLQIARPGLPELVHDVLIESGLAPDRLELEITETAIIADKEAAREVLQQIKRLGVAIALDDFGRGYSSLETLRYFPFDKIKLDRFFVTEIVGSGESRAIIRAIVALGKTLGIPVLAEGIETEDQLAVLRQEQCSEGQGYLFGRPQPAIDFSTQTRHAS